MGNSNRCVEHSQVIISDKTTGDMCADGPRKGKTTETSGGWRRDDRRQTETDKGPNCDS